ncbi:MAG: hypothetical protein LWX01_07015 [Deltaproteobacteria bacterium]|nr:hypothetical protein [Deltaproteobacteria bacterium]
MESETVFVDTSAFYALMDRSDNNFEKAAGLWRSFLEKDFYLQTSNYIIVETLALLQSRLGFEAANLWYRGNYSLSPLTANSLFQVSKHNPLGIRILVQSARG